MIISHAHKFIFIKTNKTAGTSTEIALSKFCGPDDIVTPISAVDEKTRIELGYTSAQNYKRPEGQTAIGQASPAGEPARDNLFYNHMSSAEVRSLIPQETWDSYFKFCIERNPWDRIVSLYYWRNKKTPRPTIKSWLEDGGHKILHERGRDLYTIDGTIVVDKVVRYEKLSEELEEIRVKLGLPSALELPRAKSGHRKDKRHYREILGDTERRFIEEDFAYEIETFGYTF